MISRKRKVVQSGISGDLQKMCSVLIVGLGNPGYKWTRHNVGADTLEDIIEKYPKKEISKNLYMVFFSGFCAFVYLCPDLMNISGIKIINMYEKLGCENLIVVVDDLDTEIGKVKKSFAVTSGGHNGVKSIINSLGHNRFWKVKIGINRPENEEVSEYVLGRLSQNEREVIKSIENEIEILLKSIVDSYE